MARSPLQVLLFYLISSHSSSSLETALHRAPWLARRHQDNKQSIHRVFWSATRTAWYLQLQFGLHKLIKVQHIPQVVMLIASLVHQTCSLGPYLCPGSTRPSQMVTNLSVIQLHTYLFDSVPNMLPRSLLSWFIPSECTVCSKGRTLRFVLMLILF